MLETDIIDAEGLSESGMGYARGYVVWHGVVEDIFDPRKLGRVRVRIIGWHSLDRGKMPTNTLPWAQVVKATTGSSQSSNLQLNDWVTGYFLDGFDGQRPSILGKYDGITHEKAEDLSRIIPPNERDFIIPGSLSGTGLDIGGGYGVELTAAQLEMLRHYPKPALNIVLQPGNAPSNPPLSHGTVAGTAVGVANKNRVHVCDISGAMKTAAAVARAAFGILMKGIRAAVRAVLTALGFNPESESGRFLQLALVIIRGIKYAQAFIAEINDYAQIFIFYAKKVRAMIDWILSLPKSLAAMLAGCLNELLNAVSVGFSALIGGSVGGELQKSLEAVNVIVESGKKLIDDTTKLLTVPGQIVEALATPASPEAQAAARNTILSFTSGFSTTSDSTSNVQRP
jgi:hypothetical protein